MNRVALPPASITEDLWEMLRHSEKPILVYGMGNGGDKLVSKLSALGKEVSDFFASDGFVRGQSFHGKRVLSFAEAKEKYRDFLILVSFGSARADVLDAVFSMAERYELYIPDMPLAGEDYFTADFYRENYDKCRAVYALLADDPSRDLFASLLWYKLTGKPEYLKRAQATGDEYALLNYAEMRTAIDVGAYRGDTVKEMLENAPSLEEVIAIEPDEKNYKRLKAYAETLLGVSVSPLHAAAWREAGTHAFASSGNRNATLGADAQKNAATASYQHRETTVETVKIDNLTLGRKMDYIKYDTEGAEMAALLGSQETIGRDLPHLRISVYHRSEDLFALPLWLHALMGEKYRYYLRRRLTIPAWECELIAVPQS